MKKFEINYSIDGWMTTFPEYQIVEAYGQLEAIAKFKEKYKNRRVHHIRELDANN